MTPGWGRHGSSPPEEPRTGSHPAAGGDWAQDIDWVDTRTAAHQQDPKAGRKGWLRLGGGGHKKHGPAYRRILIRRAVALTTLAVVVFAAWFLIELFQPFHGSGTGTLTVSIPAGSTSSQIGDELARDGVVASGFFFNLRAGLDGKRGALRAGVYTLKRDMSYGAALAALTGKESGAAAEFSFTIPEGDTMAQIAKLAKKAGLTGNYLKDATPKATGFSPQTWGAHKGVHSLEGFMFPSTYFLYKHGSVKALIADQLTAFKQNFADVNMSYAASKNLTDYDVITIASIVEREAQLQTDDAKVAGVIYNRLRLAIPLGLDTTLLYYLHNPHGGLTESDLSLTTDYNTRKHTGLPPTPIANPGLAALNHAAHPANVPYLYFVVKPNACGALAYATDQSTFNREVDAYNSAVSADHGALPDACPAANAKTKTKTNAKSKSKSKK
jgi:uncharacterized YceG family protein